MSQNVDSEIQDLLNTFSAVLREAFPDILRGVYVYGSCAYDAFEAMHSDIDFVVVIERLLTTQEMMTLERVHKNLCDRHPLAKRMDGQYIQASDLGKLNSQMLAYPWYRDGVFHYAGYADINSVTWWTLKHHGITVFGPAVRCLDISVTWDDVRRTMDYNLNTYWSKRASRLQTLVRDIDFSDAILTVCRITHTINNQEITTKTRAGELALSTYPPKWKRLIEEALTIRKYRRKSNLFRKLSRAYFARRFIKWAVTSHHTTR